MTDVFLKKHFKILKYSKNAPSDSRYLPFPFIHTSLLHSLHPSLSIRDCIIGRPSVQPEIESFGFKILCPISDCKLFYPSLYLLKFLRINIDENIGRPMLPSISNENAYLNRVVKPIYDLCVEVKGSIMGTTISIEKNNGPIYACCNRSVFLIIISVFKSLVYGGRSFDFQELESAIHQVFSVPTVFASTRCSMIGP